jgi:hypothetical protein
MPERTEISRPGLSSETAAIAVAPASTAARVGVGSTWIPGTTVPLTATSSPLSPK